MARRTPKARPGSRSSIPTLVAELLIHAKDGKIQKRNTYKRDPYPPRG